jgi:hypothetical protein
MTKNTRIVFGDDLACDPQSRMQRIQDILKKGKVVRFTNNINGITKDVKEWNSDIEGDLTAFRHTGSSPYICWRAEQYSISEIDE